MYSQKEIDRNLLMKLLGLQAQNNPQIDPEQNNLLQILGRTQLAFSNPFGPRRPVVVPGTETSGVGIRG